MTQAGSGVGDNLPVLQRYQNSVQTLGMAAEECPESSALQVAREMMMMMQGVDTDYELPEVKTL